MDGCNQGLFACPPPPPLFQVYRALLQLGCEWHLHSSYRIQCMWKPDAELLSPRGSLQRGAGRLRSSGGGAGQGGRLGGGGGILTSGGGGQGGHGGVGGIGAKAEGKEYRVIAGLTLYKVQMNIYLLDFHKREGDQFTFMVSCLPFFFLVDISV